ncbi:MAG: fused MFS/spermidine synthase [Planctomycetota bacterium]
MGRNRTLPGVSDREGTTALNLAVYLLAFVSGAAALMYELTWARMLALTFGSTTLSAASVIGGFLGGMGVGAWGYHLVRAKLSRPLLVYALLELGIAATTAVLTATFYSLPETLAPVSRLVGAPLVLGVVRVTCVIALLFVPSALMGATFPALCEVMIRSSANLDRRLGVVYGINTVGGAAGVVLGSLILIERLGLTGTVHVANAMNVAIAGAAGLLLLGARERGPSSLGGTETTVAAPTALPRWIIGLVLIGSGFTTLAYEMLWFRALRLFVGNSTYALGAVLIVFLCGLGLGALPLRWVLRRGRPERDLCLCQLLIAGLGLWAVVCMALVLVHPSVNEYVNIFLPQVRLQPWARRMAIIAAVALLTMLPATLVMGLSFPLASRMFVGDVRKLGRLVGGAYLLANVGSILGGVLAAVILLPVLGVNRGTQACALLNVALAALVAWRVKGIGEFAYGAAAVGLLFLAVPSSIPQAGEGNLADWRVAFVREAEQGTVHVMEMPHDSGKKVMLIDGCMIGCSSTFVESTMHLKQSAVAHLPMALQPRASRALTVGLGSASTLRTLASYAQLDTVDCVEINEAVIEGSVLFAESEVYGDPRVRVIHDDAVHYLLGARGAYDVIVSDGKQDPFYSGNAVLLCREFYQYARASLRDGGVFAQWMSLATLPEDFAVIFRTISDAFPHVETYVLPPDSVFMVAWTTPPSVPDADGGMSPRRFPELSLHGVRDVPSLLAHRSADGIQLREALGQGATSEWDKLVLDYTPFRADPRDWDRAKLENLRLLLGAEGRVGGAPDDLPLAPAPLRQAARLAREAQAMLWAGEEARAEALLTEAEGLDPENLATQRLLADVRSSSASRGSGSN